MNNQNQELAIAPTPEVLNPHKFAADKNLLTGLAGKSECKLLAGCVDEQKHGLPPKSEAATRMSVELLPGLIAVHKVGTATLMITRQPTGVRVSIDSARLQVLEVDAINGVTMFFPDV